VIDLRNYAVSDTLRDGTVILIRAVRPDDRERLLAAFHKLDPESVYTRFFEYKDEPTEGDLKRVTEADFDKRVALVVTKGTGSDEIVIGGGSYASYRRPDGGQSAEVAFTIEEDYHGFGLAGRLLRQLAGIARERGVDRFEAEVLPQNRAMLAVFARSGLPMQERKDEGVVRVTLDLSTVGAERQR
jgi:RimJ/RimL family protein N-acetyltransferase